VQAPGGKEHAIIRYFTSKRGAKGNTFLSASIH